MSRITYTKYIFFDIFLILKPFLGLIPFSYLRHLFEYIGTQFPPPSSLLYGKMGSITLFFSNGNIKYDTTFYA